MAGGQDDLNGKTEDGIDVWSFPVRPGSGYRACPVDRWTIDLEPT